MTIHALEAGDPLTTAAVRRYPTAHQRCGTEFLVVVIALSILMFSLVGRQSPLVMVGSRILLIPVIAAVGYELLRLGARHRANPVVQAIMWPGILVQKITTRQPTDDMIEVAIVSMEQALAADGEAIPDGSAAFEREPLARGRGAAAGPFGRRAGRGGRGDRAGTAWRSRRPARRPGCPAPVAGPVETERPALGRMIDAKLLEVVARYDAVQAELAQPETCDRPGRDPAARPGAGPARAGRLGHPPARADPRRAGRRPRAARRRDRR